MEKKPVRYAVVGCGTHAWRGHVEPALGVEGLELAAVCDPDIDKTIAFMDQAGRHVMNSASTYELFRRPDIDAVLICSPDRFHLEQLEEAVIRGKHVMVEKPAAATLAELSMLNDLLDGEQIITSCHPRRFDDLYIHVRSALPAWVEAHGKPIEMAFDFSYHEPTKTGLHTGLLMDHVNHEYDLMNFLFGYSPCVAHKLYDAQDRYHAAGVRDDGMAFTFIGTRRLKTKGRFPEFMCIRFERATLTIDCEHGLVRVHDHEQPTKSYGEIVPHSDYPTKFRRLMENFRDAIRGDAPNYLTSTDIYNNSAIGVCLTETGRWQG